MEVFRSQQAEPQQSLVEHEQIFRKVIFIPSHSCSPVALCVLTKELYFIYFPLVLATLNFCFFTSAFLFISLLFPPLLS